MKSFNSQISLWFAILMVIVVSAGAITFSLTDLLSDRLYGSKRTIFIVVLFSYAIYRGWRIYMVFKSKKNEE